MNLREIAAKLRSGELTLDTAGHRTNQWTSILEQLLGRIDKDVAMGQGQNDGKWGELRDTENIDEVNARMRNFYNRRLDVDVEQEDIVVTGEREHCSGCGKNMNWVLTGNKLQLRNYFDKEANDLLNYPVDYICPYSKGSIQNPTRGEIQVNSSLIISNFFNFSDCPDELEYTEEWSLCNLVGRENITRYKATTHNVAYGQMSNMAIGVYVHPNGRSIIIGDAFLQDTIAEKMNMTDEEYENADWETMSMIDGHKLVDTISLAVWRWEATDMKTIGKSRLKKLNRDFVEVPVEHGIWQFEHYFDLEIGAFERIYSRLTLKT